MTDFNKQTRYYKAKKRVSKEMSFYKHTTLYLIVNIIIFIVILQLKEYIYPEYLILNLISTPLLWGIFLLGHGLWAFKKENRLLALSRKLFPFKKWEERKIKELINEYDEIE